MGFYDLKQYKEFEKELGKFIGLNVNLEIVSVPGVGVSHYFKKFLEKCRLKGVKYIADAGERLERYNFLDLDWDKNPEAMEQTVNYMKSASVEQKFAVVINTPGVLETSGYKISYLASHVYERYYFKAREKEDVEVYLKDMGVKIGDAEAKKIYGMTGGVGRWVKLLAIHKEWWEWLAERVLEEEGARQVVEPTARVAARCGEAVLETLGLKKDGRWTAGLLEAYFGKYPAKVRIRIEVGPDLALVEKGETGERLARVEAEIVRWMVGHDGVIEKEKVADFKWGEGGYDKFSDQAINKTMRRISRKMKYYQIEAISGYGFKIAEKT